MRGDETCRVCGDPLAFHPDDMPCEPAPSYPELPEGCQIEEGRRRLAVGETVRIGDRFWSEVDTVGTMDWVELDAGDVEFSALECVLSDEIASRAVEKKP
jgi:hypothetical protein